MIVDAERDRVAQRLARRDQPARRDGDRLARLVDGRRAVVCAGQTEARPALLHEEPALVDHRRPRLGGGGREGRHPVPLLPAEKLVDRHAQRLAANVVERDVDRRDGGSQHPATLEVLAPIHLLPERAGTHRVAPDEELRVVLECAHHRLLAARQPRFTPAVHALVGLDLDEQLVPNPHPGGVRLDRRDPHTLDPSSAARGRPDARSGRVSIIGEDVSAAQASVRRPRDRTRSKAAARVHSRCLTPLRASRTIDSGYPRWPTRRP